MRIVPHSRRRWCCSRPRWRRKASFAGPIRPDARASLFDFVPDTYLQQSGDARTQEQIRKKRYLRRQKKEDSKKEESSYALASSSDTAAKRADALPWRVGPTSAVTGHSNKQAPTCRRSWKKKKNFLKFLNIVVEFDEWIQKKKQKQNLEEY